MSLKLYLILIVIAGLSIYVAFLNPGEMEVYFTQSFSWELPKVVVLLGAALLGVGLTGLFSWVEGVKGSIRSSRAAARRRDKENRARQVEKTLTEADNALAAGHFPQAESLYQKIARTQNNVRALYGLGVSLRAQDNAKDALKAHLKARVAEPDNVRVLYALAADYESAGEPKKQIEVLQQIVGLDRNAVTALEKIRDAHENAKDWENAYEAQRKILPLVSGQGALAREQKRFGDIIHAHAQKCLEENDREKALAELKRAVREDNQHTESYLALADLYTNAGEDKSALKTWKAGYDNTKAPVFLLKIQNALQQKDQGKDIEKLYQAAIRLASGEGQAVASLLYSVYLLESGSRDQAIKTLETLPEGECLVHQVLLYTARNAESVNGSMPDSMKAVYEQAKQNLIDLASKTVDG